MDNTILQSLHFMCKKNGYIKKIEDVLSNKIYTQLIEEVGSYYSYIGMLNDSEILLFGAYCNSFIIVDTESETQRRLNIILDKESNKHLIKSCGLFDEEKIFSLHELIEAI